MRQFYGLPLSRVQGDLAQLLRMVRQLPGGSRVAQILNPGLPGLGAEAHLLAALIDEVRAWRIDFARFAHALSGAAGDPPEYPPRLSGDGQPEPQPQPNAVADAAGFLSALGVAPA